VKDKAKTKIQTTINTILLNKFKKIAENEGRHLNYYLEKGLGIILKDYEHSGSEM
jgi:hypothetical protein